MATWAKRLVQPKWLELYRSQRTWEKGEPSPRAGEFRVETGYASQEAPVTGKD